jgi:hypothetical protein
VRKSKQKITLTACRCCTAILKLLLAIVVIIAMLGGMVSFATFGFFFARAHYLPDVCHTLPVYFDFGSEMAMPVAHVSFDTQQWSHGLVLAKTTLSRSPLLRAGIAYDLRLELALPASTVNRRLGMLMVAVELLHASEQVSSLVCSSCSMCMR